MPKYTARLRYVVTVDAQFDAPDWHAASQLAEDTRLADLVTPRVAVELHGERQFSRIVEPLMEPDRTDDAVLDMPEWLSRYPKP